MKCIEYFDLITGRLFSLNTIDVKEKVPDFAYNPLNKFGKLYEPVVDQEWLSNGKNKPVWPDNKPYAVCLTHDVDFVSKYGIHQNVRFFLKAIKTLSKKRVRKNMSMLMDAVSQIVIGLTSRDKDPIHRFEDWLTVEGEIGAKSTFFFSPQKVNKDHFSDCTYAYNDKIRYQGSVCSVADLMRDLDKRGFEIGLHSSWWSYDDIDEMRFQKIQIESIIGHEIVSVRQHFLHYDVKKTPLVHSAVGFKYDGTLGFNDNIGFRRGTSYPFYLFDQDENETLPVLEIPLVIQESAMLMDGKGMRIDKELALEYIYLLSQKVKKTGGVLTLLWHSHTIMNDVFWQTYLGALKILKSDNPWFASVKEIGEWWNKEVKIDLVDFLENNN